MISALRIAIADDEARMRDYLRTSLERLGYEVVGRAKTGRERELVELCRQSHPNLIITDIKMPDMDGLEAVKTICQEESIPVILISAFFDQEYIEKAMQDYVLAYLVKPIKHESLKPTITIAVKRFKQIQDLQKQAEECKRALEQCK